MYFNWPALVLYLIILPSFTIICLILHQGLGEMPYLSPVQGTWLNDNKAWQEWLSRQPKRQNMRVMKVIHSLSINIYEDKQPSLTTNKMNLWSLKMLLAPRMRQTEDNEENEIACEVFSGPFQRTCQITTLCLLIGHWTSLQCNKAEFRGRRYVQEICQAYI